MFTPMIRFEDDIVFKTESEHDLQRSLIEMQMNIKCVKIQVNQTF